MRRRREKNGLTKLKKTVSRDHIIVILAAGRACDFHRMDPLGRKQRTTRRNNIIMAYYGYAWCLIATSYFTRLFRFYYFLWIHLHETSGAPRRITVLKHNYLHGFVFKRLRDCDFSARFFNYVVSVTAAEYTSVTVTEPSE